VAHLKIHTVVLELLELVLAMAVVAVLMLAVAQVRQVLLLLNGKRINYEKSNY
jgi:cytochrome b